MGRGFWKPQARLGPPTAVNTFFRTVETVKTGRGRGGGPGGVAEGPGFWRDPTRDSRNALRCSRDRSKVR